MAPEKIGRYEIRSELGRGGMATVYHGYDPRFEREVAVKVLPSELLHSDPQFKLRFEREAKIIAQLEHPSIVPVYDVGEDGGQPYFVMRYMNGGSLSERIKAKVMNVEEAAKILGQIAPGLDEAHSKGIVHRDLKPSNILFDGKGTPYISDFGIAKISRAQVSNVTGSGIIGTPAYMAPEQASGETVDGRSDIYALGIILFEMLTGRQPYEADTPMAIAIKHITDPVPHILEANPSLPPDVEEIIQVAMAKSKDDRFSSAVEMVDALRAIGTGGKAQLRTRTMKAAAPKTVVASEKAVTQIEKRPFNIWLVVVPVLLLGMIGGGYLIFNGINNRPTETEPPITVTYTSAPATATTEPTLSATDDTSLILPPTEIPTDTPVPVTDTPAPPTVPEFGGADMIALVANREIWLMNVDGTDRKQITFDGGTKNDLQWLDRDTLLFISGKTVKYYTVSTDKVETLTSFNSEVSLDAFRVSHDGTQVMIAMSNEIFVVSFDREFLKTVSNRGTLSTGSFCIWPTPKTEAALRVQEARWSFDDKLVAWLYIGNDPGKPSVNADQILVLDISTCDPERITKESGEIPGTYFTPARYNGNDLPDFDWNGRDLFTFNTNYRNDGWGEFYGFNYKTNRPTQFRPVNNSCCYRDIRWSPDGNYVLFAYQDELLGGNAKNLLYYVEAGLLDAGAVPTLIELPDGFFKNPKEAPQPAWRPLK